MTRRATPTAEAALMTLCRDSFNSRVASVAPTTLVHATAWNQPLQISSPYNIPRPGPAGPTPASASGPQFPLKEPSYRLGHDVAAADIDARSREGAVRLLGGGGGRDGGAGF